MPFRRGLPEWTTLLVLVSVWGSSFALTKIAVQTIPPIWVPALRLVLAAVLLAAVMAVRRISWPRGANNWLWLAWFAVIGNIMPFFMISWATQHVASSLAGILMAVNPLLVLVLSRLLLPDEPVRLSNVIGFLIGFAGVVMLIGPAALLQLGDAGIELAAQFALILAAFGYASMNVSARLAPKMGLIPLSAGTMFVAALMALAAAIIHDPNGLVGVSTSSATAVLLLALFPTTLATLCLYWLVARAGSRFLAMSNYAVPVFAILVGWFFLHERLDAGDLAGFALICLGLAISESRLLEIVLRQRPEER
ncbi:MAG TPA: DMT family transporter [Afifellaceae bacterium]|nr:DMT family transporter [Afifellaceae bacterium]